MYNKIDSSRSFVQMEKDIAKLWNDKDVIQKNFDANKDGKYFTFYDGPPTANGLPHPGHVLTRVMKDLVLRYKAMNGHYILRKAGWDTHGLPVEIEVEKKLGLEDKQAVEKYGLKSLEYDHTKNNSENFTDFIIEQIRHYCDWQFIAEKGFKYIPKRYLIPVKTASEMYKWTAGQILKEPFVVYSYKVKPFLTHILTKTIQNIIDPHKTSFNIFPCILTKPILERC